MKACRGFQTEETTGIPADVVCLIGTNPPSEVCTKLPALMVGNDYLFNRKKYLDRRYPNGISIKRY
jgi:hypothetical protein